MSVATDVKILVMTLRRVLCPRGAPDVTRWLQALGLRRVQYVLDLAVLGGAFVLAHILRFDGLPPASSLAFKQMAFQLPWVMLLQLAMYQLFGVFAFVWRYVGLREMRAMASAVGLSAIMLAGVRLGAPAGMHYARVPLSIVVMNAMLVFLGGAGVRVLRRASYEGSQRRSARVPGSDRRVLLIGAGRAGVLVAREIYSRGDTGLLPVGFVDDDLVKAGTVIHGLKVLGNTQDLPRLVKDLRIDHVVISIASTPSSEIRRIVALCERIPIKVRIIPGLFEILEGRVSISRVRDVQIEDLLGREPVEMLREPVEAMVRERVVMVTGAGGSIGSELCRQVCRFGIAELLMVEQAETPLFDIDRELRRAHPEVRLLPAIADVCDVPRMAQIFRERKPAVVLHAAAHKHVPMMEWNPGEAIKNNLIGTQVLADLALRHQASTFVLISTDKAVNPTSIMGASKRLAEIYVQSLSRSGQTKFVAVRFGNVLGSSGSVVRIFKEQIARGGPVTVTHPQMKRYFMTVQEATQLVLQAAAIGEGGEIFVLDMGEPVSVLELARDMITLSGLKPYEDIDIVMTGTRPGEKLFEELGFSDELMSRTRHPKIHIGKIRPYPEERVKEIMARAVMLNGHCSAADVHAFLREALPEFRFDAPEASAPEDVVEAPEAAE